MDNSVFNNSSLKLKMTDSDIEHEMGVIEDIVSEELGDMLKPNIETKTITLDTTFDPPREFYDRFHEACMKMDEAVHSFAVKLSDSIVNTFDLSMLNIKTEITNIHRVRKGKRYVIKFDYTGLVTYTGKVVS